MTLKSKAAAHFPRYRREMEIDKAVEIWDAIPPPDRLHIGLGQVPELNPSPDGRYPGKGAEGLVDGWIGSPSQIDSRWCGFHENSLEATIKVKTNSILHYVGARFLQDAAKGIYFPQRLEVLAFKDDDFHVVGVLDVKQPKDQQTPMAKEFGIELTDCVTPQIRFRAISRKVSDNTGADGHTAWILVDELITH